MYFLQYYARVAVLLYVMVMMINHSICSKRQKEQAFSEVLKNITLANKILEELLHNYERLEKIDQSDELFSSDSSSHKVDQSFKSFKSNKQNFKQRNKLPKTQTETSSPFKGTAMIYENEPIESDSEDTTEKVKEVNIDTKSEKPHPKHVINKIVDNKLNSEVDNKVYNKKLNKDDDVSNLSKQESSSEDTQSDEIEKIIIDISEDVRSDNYKDKMDVAVATTNTPHERNLKAPSNKALKNIIGEKKRFSIQHFPPKKIVRAHISKRASKIKTNDTEIKKAAYYKNKSPDKISNKPVTLRKGKEVFFRKSNKSNSNKITILIITNNDKTNDYWRDGSKNQKFNTKGFSNFNWRSNYGETCLGIPIKKCKKALKIVNKNICKRRFKCKSDFKSDFITNANNGCNKEFAYRQENANKTNNTKDNTEKFSPPDFSELKMKHLQSKLGQRNIENLSSKLQKPFISLRNETLQDMLRGRKDKYERRCKKESMKKCNNACSYAIKETCNVHTCEKKKEKAIKIECKNQCKKAYENVKKSITSSSNSDSDSEDDSDSDNESD